jgi:S-DNA-T family DNA segregation ATPase FtsK/SpoIIIE
MQASCAQCRAKYTLDDAKIAGHARVQFKCVKCGHTTVVDRAAAAPGASAPASAPGAAKPKPIETQAVTPLPSFASGGKSHQSAATMVSSDAGLYLPGDKTITVSVIAGPAKGQTHKMVKARMVMGRSGADFDVNDPEISRWHAAIEVKGDVIRLRDLDSTNGIFLDDERVRVAELRHLSEFRIGSSVMLVTVTQKDV